LVLAWAAGPAMAQPPAGPPPASPVKVAHVTERSVAQTTLIMGVLDFDVVSGISAEVSGKVASQNMVEGARVRAGDVLVRLNTDFLEKSLQALDAQIAQTVIRMDNTRRNLERYKVLYEKDAATQKAYEDLADSLAELGKQKEVLESNRQTLVLQREKSVIRAPFDGMILARQRTEGEWVAPGTPLCELAAVSDVVVEVPVSEDLVPYVQPGAEVRMRIVAVGRELSGVIRNFVPVANPQSKTFTVKISVPDFPEAIRNMSVAVQVPSSEKKMLKMIPRDALVPFQGKQMAFAVAEGKAAPIPLNIVSYQGAFVGVSNPEITVGMPVVVEGNERLRPGQDVMIVNPDAGPEPEPVANPGAGTKPEPGPQN
ncbi:MAG: efflux RND transporter periplasmic adaptor subunit, partial [Pseudomonadota bacterium]